MERGTKGSALIVRENSQWLGDVVDRITAWRCWRRKGTVELFELGAVGPRALSMSRHLVGNRGV